jgi:hypothetical protein
VKGNRPRTFSNRKRLDSSLYISWFASELCLSAAMLCCSVGFVTRVKIEQCINPKYVVKLRKELCLAFIPYLVVVQVSGDRANLYGLGPIE